MRAGTPAEGPRRMAPRALAALLAMALGGGAGLAETNSGRYRFEGNKWLSLDLTVADVHADVIRFEWPATLLRMKTGYKATVKVANGSARQARIGIALVLYDAEARPVGVGTTGTKLGTVDPGDAAEFSISFDHVTERLEQATQFHLVLEVR